MKYKSLEELSSAYGRMKLRAIGIFIIALLGWGGLFVATLSLIARWTRPWPNWMMLPVGLGFMIGGITFGLAVLYFFNRDQLVCCAHCNAPIAEYDEFHPQHGKVIPICRKCGKSVVEVDNTSPHA